MSWDIFVQDLPGEARSIADIPRDFRPKPLGSRSEIITKIKEICPLAAFSSDSGWGSISGPGLAIDVNVGDEEPVMCVAFHVYGGEAAPGVVADMLDGLGLRGLDCGGDSETGFFDREAAEGSFRRWREYRDHVLRVAKGNSA